MTLPLLFVCLSFLLSQAFAVLVTPETFASTVYDFIVVGGGTAGVTVGVRLSENPNWKVGIIEAGDYKPNDPRILIPMGWVGGDIWGNPYYDWGFETVPQSNLNNRSISIVRGKILGGSSALNLMGYVRAGAVEYDQIGQLGNEGWSWEQILQYFIKTENITAASPVLQSEYHATYEPAYHGTTGPIQTSFSVYNNPVTTAFFNTLVGMGIPAVEDGEAGYEVKVFNPTLSIDPSTETRSYAAVSYYEPNAARSNLHVLLNSTVTKVNTKSARQGVVATSVAFYSGGKYYTSKSVAKEVVVSCGGIQSPQILELSGIGNKTRLEALGIQSVLNLPTVGENYQDHLGVSISFQIPSSIETWDVFYDPSQNATAYQQYLTNKTGPYASSINAGGNMDATQFISASDLAAWTAELDAQFYASNPTAGQKAMYAIQRARLNGTSTEATLELYSTPSYTGNNLLLNESYVSLTAIPVHPFSRGSIHINSSNPFDYPVIDLNAFHYDIDKRIFTAGTRMLRQIAYTPPLSSYVIADSYPDPSNMTAAQWDAYVAENAENPFHPMGTVAMLPENLGGVVSNKLVVYGSTNLRVVDLSILPLQLATHLQATAYAIGEQAADFIKATWSSTS